MALPEMCDYSRGRAFLYVSKCVCKLHSAVAHANVTYSNIKTGNGPGNTQVLSEINFSAGTTSRESRHSRSAGRVVDTAAHTTHVPRHEVDARPTQLTGPTLRQRRPWPRRAPAPRAAFGLARSFLVRPARPSRPFGPAHPHSGRWPPCHLPAFRLRSDPIFKTSARLPDAELAGGDPELPSSTSRWRKRCSSASDRRSPGPRHSAARTSAACCESVRRAASRGW